jgi:hypothetical protein
VTILAIPPDHALAVELYDLIGLQGVIISKQNAEAELVNAGGDRTQYDRLDTAMGTVNEKVEAIRRQYQVECGSIGRVGLTYDARGFPVVNGRPGAPQVN